MARSGSGHQAEGAFGLVHENLGGSVDVVVKERIQGAGDDLLAAAFGKLRPSAQPTRESAVAGTRGRGQRVSLELDELTHLLQELRPHALHVEQLVKGCEGSGGNNILGHLLRDALDGGYVPEGCRVE
jgi:hypothetical protein